MPNDQPSPVHLLLAYASGTDHEEWKPCDGPRPGSVPFASWFVRKSEGYPDIYAIVSGDAEETTVELIPAAQGETDAFLVAKGALANDQETEPTDIDCGVVFQGPLDGPEAAAISAIP